VRAGIRETRAKLSIRLSALVSITSPITTSVGAYFNCAVEHLLFAVDLTSLLERFRIPFFQFDSRGAAMQLRNALLVMLLFMQFTVAQDRRTARSMVISRYGIVATTHVQASQAGAEILRKGGSAMDAAIAANAVLGLTEPMMNGIGGDLFAIYWVAKSGKLYGLNSSGWAPRGLTLEHMRAKGLAHMPLRSIDTVTVPGTVAGWKALHGRFGKLPWNELFQSAVFYAEQGYPVPELIHEFWGDAIPVFADDPEGRRVYLPNNHIPAVGEIFKNPDLAKALRLIAQTGPDAYYRGEIAQAILRTSAAHEGTMAAADLSEFQPEWVQPISTTYRDWTVYELPPNGQGMAALEMLNIMETAPASPEGPLSATELHKKIEAMKLAYADLNRYNADPRFAKVPVQGLLSKDYAQERAKRMDPKHANCDVSYGMPRSDTTYLTAVDREGNIASLIQSNFESFGSGIIVRGMGFVLQDRGALFSLDPNSPNVLAPRKRPFHTIIPAFMQRGGQHIGFGIMGGANQPLAHAQFVSNIADYGMNIQQALETARFTVHPERGCNIYIESRVTPEVRDKLSNMGHKLYVQKEYSTLMGRGNAVLHDSKANVNYGGSDARADGSAEPEPPPPMQSLAGRNSQVVARKPR
jgi:gamma-glutamyltranspeptidase / glutathione hydrolase